MQNLLPRRAKIAAFLSLSALAGAGAFSSYRASAQNGVASGGATAENRPQYRIRASIDYDLLTLKSSAQIQIPASPNDPLSDAAFFLYANASGVGGDDERRKNIVVDSVKLGGASLPFQLNGAVLKVNLNEAQSAPFSLQINYHGVVPRGAKDEGGLSSLMGGALGGDISSLLGIGGQSAPKETPKNTDYGLYTYGNGILSLGSFWYPALAVRQNGRWIEGAPEGLGDVAFAEKSDFDVQISAPQGWKLAAPGQITQNATAGGTNFQVRANDVREFAVLLSEDFVQKSRVFSIGSRSVTVSALLRRENSAKLDKTLDIAGNALQIYSKRFGPYPFAEFKLVEAPMKSGAGGMEYSRMVGIASSVYMDIGAQLGGLTTSLQIPGADALLKSLGDEGGTGLDENGEEAAGAAPEAAAPDDDGGGMTDMVGGILGQQKEIFDSLLEETIAHEVAHQWWAIGVGSDSQKHPFVDESLTNWSSMLYFEDRYGAQKAEQMRDLHLKTSFSMGAMMGGGDAPANLPTSAYTNNLQYGAVIYGKGALFYDTLRDLVGEAAFYGSLRDYYAQWNDKIADDHTLRALMESHAPAKRGQIEALYKRWIEGAHGKEDISGGMSLDLGGLLDGLMGGNLGDDQ